jgi:hypothetical protein
MTTYPLWDCLDKAEQKALTLIMPTDWTPNVRREVPESLREIDRIMREPAQGELAKILSGKEIS